MTDSITLLELTNRIGRAISMERGTQMQWVTAELSDVSTKGGHTYMELIQKDERGNQVAKARAMIWRTYAGEIRRFTEATGQQFCSGIKLRVQASASMHALYGLSLTVTAIDPEFTMGDLLIRRREILDRLTRENVLHLNRNLEWKALPLNVAVISAPEAAGYGDFMNHINTSGIRFRFKTRLFPAVMQGDKTVTTVMEALATIERERDQWDCVVIIRGGGATSDLAAFENYELARRVATYHIPVVIGIGHERDITVLDYVANMRVKTPTAAADFLVQHWNGMLEKLERYSQIVCDMANEKVHVENMQLSYIKNNIVNFANNAIERGRNRINRNVIILESVNGRLIAPCRRHLDGVKDSLKLIGISQLGRCRTSLQGLGKLVDALSPKSVLKRGYSITKVGGQILKSAKSELPSGTVIETLFIDGKIESEIK